MLSRRRLVQGALAALPLANRARLARPADELRLAIVGLDGRGGQLAAALAGRRDVRLTALCDVDELVLLRESRRARERGVRPEVHGEYRRVLERTDVDAVVLATPDHWHALQALWACQAGKDVYLESPATHLYSENAPLVAAAASTGRMVQCGLEARASAAVAEALAWLQTGQLGAIELVHGVCFVPRPPLGRTKGNQPVPESVDYDRWCGPAPLLPLRRARLHHDWRWFHAFGAGELGDRAGQVLDLARLMAGAEELPARVRSVGLRFHEDDGETPDSAVVFLATAPVPILLELRGLPRDAAARETPDWSAAMDEELGVRAGVVVRCAGGTLAIPEPGRAVARDPEGTEVRRFEGGGDLLAGWLEACRARRVEALAAPPETGVRSAALAQLANASHRTGRRVPRAEIDAACADNACLATGVERLAKHLDAHGLDLSTPRLVLGTELVLDEGTGTYAGHDSLASLLAGSHREPYVLPRV